MENNNKLYAVIFELQKDQISEWCWGSCGYGICGAVDFEPFSAVPCRHSPCPHVEREMDEPMGEVNGESIYLRKLLPVK